MNKQTIDVIKLKVFLSKRTTTEHIEIMLNDYIKHLDLGEPTIFQFNKEKKKALIYYYSKDICFLEKKKYILFEMIDYQDWKKLPINEGDIFFEPGKKDLNHEVRDAALGYFLEDKEEDLPSIFIQCKDIRPKAKKALVKKYTLGQKEGLLTD